MSINTKRFYKFGLNLALSASILCSSNAMASVNEGAGLNGAFAMFKNIDTPIRKAVEEAAEYYYQNNGVPMNQAYNKVGGDSNENNPYFDILRINTDYSVYIKLSSASRRITEHGINAIVPVVKALSGSEFVLYPDYISASNATNADNTTVISSWYCLTNADSKISMFMGDTKTMPNTASLITNYTNNPYLNSCIYVGENVNLSGS